MSNAISRQTIWSLSVLSFNTNLLIMNKSVLFWLILSPFSLEGSVAVIINAVIDHDIQPTDVFADYIISKQLDATKIWFDKSNKMVAPPKEMESEESNEIESRGLVGDIKGVSISLVIAQTNHKLSIRLRFLQKW